MKNAFLFILGIDIFIKMVYNMQVFTKIMHIYAKQGVYYESY